MVFRLLLGMHTVSTPSPPVHNRFLPRRLLFTCFPLPAATIITWTGVTMGGAPFAAPCFALAMYAAVGLYAVPLRSALGGGGAGGVSPAFDFCASRSLKRCHCHLLFAPGSAAEFCRARCNRGTQGHTVHAVYGRPGTAQIECYHR